MALIDKKVSEAYSGRDISSLSNRPNEDGIDGEELKARFDQLGKEVIPNFNDVIDILTDGQIEDIMIAYSSGALDGATIVSAEVVGNDIIFTKDDSTTVTLSGVMLTLKGDDGASIVSGSFIGNDLVFVKDDSETVIIEDAKITLKGEQGVQGQGFVISGHYDTLLDLETAHPIGVVGDAWSVGTVEPYDVYVWNTDLNDWDNIGQISPSNNASQIDYDNSTSGLLAENLQDATDELQANKVEKVSGKGLSTEDYTSAEKTKLSGIETNANNYSHPANHSPSIITQDSSNRFVTDAEKSTWNGKASVLDLTVTLPSTSWTGASAPYTKAVTLSGILSTDKPIVDIEPSGTYATDVIMRENWKKVYDLDTSTNTLTFYADSVPSADIPLKVKVIR